MATQILQAHEEKTVLLEWIADLVVVNVVEVKSAFWQYVVEKCTMLFKQKRRINKTSIEATNWAFKKSRFLPDNNNSRRLTLLQTIQQCRRKNKVAQMVDGKVVLDAICTQSPGSPAHATVVHEDMER